MGYNLAIETNYNSLNQNLQEGGAVALALQQCEIDKLSDFPITVPTLFTMSICAWGDRAILQIAGGGQAFVGAYHRILKLVRTIAELVGSEEIQSVATCRYQRMRSGTIRVLLARCILPGTCCNHSSSRIDHAQDESERNASNRS
jgi:hypothetical protein